MNDVQVIKANRNENRIRGRKVEILRVAAYCRVSTDSEDQLNSYKSQVMYYTDLIKKKPEWSLADIYADEAITGTQVTKREDFQRMINDCMNGDIDMVITKSISRFARNTLDTLKYVRMLKEKGIAVFFEDENINTLTMDGELLLVVLSSVAQQEVENISSNVKKGLKMKMQRGELVGFQGCLGYDYHKDTKSISVNEKEAEIVRYIFNRYIEGAGCTVIANELENLGYKTKYGSSRWVQSTVIGIIKNEKYKGDLLLGKTFTVDPISKRRLENFGEEDKFYIRDHHEAIISEEIFEEAQKILAKRNVNRGVHQEGQKRNKFSRKYAFSCMIKCGFCGGTLSRRNWHSSSAYTKTIWHCVTATKHGKKNCPHCKGIPEEVIENAFVKSYQLLCSDQHEVVSEFLQKVEDILKDDASLKRLPKIEKEMTDLQRRKEKLLDLRLDNNIDRDIYDKKNQELSEQLKKLQAEQLQLVELSKNQESTKTRIKEFRKNLNSGELLENFDRVVFESVVERIIIGGYNDEGVADPLKITFVYKTGIHSNLNAKDFKPKRKNAAAVHTDAELCSYASVEDDKLCLHSSSDTYRNRRGIGQKLTKREWNSHRSASCAAVASFLLGVGSRAAGFFGAGAQLAENGRIIGAEIAVFRKQEHNVVPQLKVAQFDHAERAHRLLLADGRAVEKRHAVAAFEQRLDRADVADLDRAGKIRRRQAVLLQVILQDHARARALLAQQQRLAQQVRQRAAAVARGLLRVSGGDILLRAEDEKIILRLRKVTLDDRKIQLTGIELAQ